VGGRPQDGEGLVSMPYLTTFFTLARAQLNNYRIIEAFLFLSLNFNMFACGVGAGVDRMRERFWGEDKITENKTTQMFCYASTRCHK
jgi:hypothetical protein